MQRMPTGMYAVGESLLHRLDARAKILDFILLLVTVICADAIIEYVLLLAIALALIYLSRLPLRTAVGTVRNLYPFFIIIFFMNACFYAGENALFTLWILQPSAAGVRQGLYVVCRILFILVFANLLTCTTAPMELMRALEWMLSPLSYLHVPTEQIAMIFSVAFQFIPTLSEETELIYKAQMARGARFHSRNIKDKASAVFPLVIPVFVAAFKRADELAVAMEARGYRPGKRRQGRSRAAAWKQEDRVMFVIFAVIAGAFFFIR